MTRRYGHDPFWMQAKFDGKCAKKGCDVPIRKGEQIFRYPKLRKSYGSACGHAREASNDFEAAAQDEDFMSGGLF